MMTTIFCGARAASVTKGTPVGSMAWPKSWPVKASIFPQILVLVTSLSGMNAMHSTAASIITTAAMRRGRCRRTGIMRLRYDIPKYAPINSASDPKTQYMPSAVP